MPLIQELPETQKPFVVVEGGRGSGKSRGIVQWLVLRSLKRETRIAVLRKVADSIRDSVYREIEDLVGDWGLEEYFKFTVSPLAITNTIGSSFVTKGLDKPEKIKSLANFDIFVIEEATEITEDDWITLSLSLRGSAQALKQKVLIFNRQEGHWTEKWFFKDDGSIWDRDDTYHIHTTFADNNFLNKEFIEELESLKSRDWELYQKNALGLPIRLSGLVYPEYKIVDSFPECSQIVYGMDFGYNDPTVLVKVGRKEQNLYIDEMVYERKKTNYDILRIMDERCENKSSMEIFGDSAEPDRIEELHRGGYNIKPSTKEVLDGVDCVKRFNLHITSRSTNVIKDVNSYKWGHDKNHVRVDRPMHVGSHGPDAIRYAVHTAWGKEFMNLRESDFDDVNLSFRLTEPSLWY